MAEKPHAKTSEQKTRKEHKFDFKWIVFCIIAVATVVGVVFMNINATDNTAEKITGTISTDNGDLKINWDRYPTYEIELTESLTITEAGTYRLTGSLEDGFIRLDIKNTVAKLILDNVTIKNSSGPAIFCTDGKDLVIELVGENYLEDGAIYDSNYDETVSGAIYSKADLTFGGDGKLTVKANYQDGIVGKDDLKFNGGVYEVTSADDSIRGTDSVYIVDGDFTIRSTADAIKTTNEIDQGKGFILIENGNFDIISVGKALKASSSILIYDGHFTIDSKDDSIHSNNYVGIIGGDFNLSSGDDGIHADREAIIDGGNVNITKAYEGLEAQAITINGGELSITASDDGINAGGGADGSSTNRVGANPFAADENCVININGGNVYVNAGGDGIDSNGYLYFNGGKVIVDGPTNNGNGALDASAGVSMSGGEVIAVGSSGMAETLGNNSGVSNLSIYLSSTQTTGTKFTLKNSSGETILEHTSAKTFSHIAAGSEKLVPGETYTIYLNDEEYETFTISTVTTTIGNSNTNQNMQNMRRRN